jgi:hypothetical protein
LGLADRIERQHKRARLVGRRYPISADEEQLARLGMGDDGLEELQCGCIQPLQVVSQRVLLQPPPGSGGTPSETGSAHPEAGGPEPAAAARRSARVGDEGRDKLTVWAERLSDRASPVGNLRLVFAQDLTDETLKGLRETRVGGCRDCTGRTCRMRRARRKPNQHADPVCLLRLLANRKQRAERYGTCHTSQQFAPPHRNLPVGSPFRC